MSQNDFHIRTQANPIAAWFIILVSGAFAALSFLGAATRSFRSADDYFLLVMGVALAIFTWRLARYFLKPVLSVTADALVIRRFWKRSTDIQLSEVARFETWTQHIKESRGKTLAIPLTVAHLAAHLKDGEVVETILPNFAGGNERLFEALQTRSGVRVDRLG